MPIHNADIADIFDEIADYLEIDGENPFRIRAYRNAARTVRGLGTELKDMVERQEELTLLPGIGKDLAAKIHEILETGTAQALRKLQARIPRAVTELLKIPNLGPKRVRVLYHDLNIETGAQLLEAAASGRIRELAGFGAKIEQRILEALEAKATKKPRMLISFVEPYVNSLLDYLRQVSGVQRVVVAGSFRRSRETVGDIDILVTTDKDSPLMDQFAVYDEVTTVLSRGTTRSSVVLRCGLQVDVRLVAQSSFGAALQYFTGSQAHNITIRRLAQQRGYKINEYGVFKGDQTIAGDTEESVYQILDLPLIPPELREDRGEINAAQQGKLPRLVELADLSGDLHVHTRASDGRHSLREMAESARKRGLQYIAITEHSQRLKMAKGLDSKRLMQQVDEIDRLNEAVKGITILKGIEVDILEDGRLDLPDAVLGRLDLVVGAVHGYFNLSADKQTQRLLRAMDHPHFSILAHPTGRLINERDPFAIDIARIIRKARERGCFLELNAYPKRLDLTDTYCQMAKDEGVLVAISSDAHIPGDFDNLRFGIGQARRGWLEASDELNTRSLPQLRKLLGQTM